MPEKNDIKRLEERIQALSEEKRAAQEALQTASDLGGFLTSLNKLDDPGPILEDAAGRVRRLARFSCLCFHLVDEADSSFHLAWCDPPEAAADMKRLTEQLVDDMTFAWALSRNKPVIVTAPGDTDQVLLHAMPTTSRTRGMFMGLLDQDRSTITDAAHSLLTIVMLATAHELESFELYRRTRAMNAALEDNVARLERAEQELRVHRRDLEDLVARRTVELAAVNKQLRAEIEERRQAQETLAEVNAGLSQMVEEQTKDVVQKAKDLIIANKRLRELDEMKSAFISSVSHELRTPLTSVKGFAKLTAKNFNKDFAPLARDDQRLSAKARQISESLEIIQDEAERLTLLVEDVLDLSRIESGRMRWRESEVRLDDLLEQAAEVIRRRHAGRPEVSVQVLVQPDLPPLLLDRDRAMQVLANLLDNAVKFTPQGLVLVSGRRQDDGALKIEVSDTGVGILAKDLEAVFERFHQHSPGQAPEDQDKPRGTGLGLAISRRIVEHYGGTIHAESEPGRGSVFHIRLPATVFAPLDKADPDRP